MTFLSIIIPFDRPARYLKDCLDSLSEQEMEDTEVILIINGNDEDISDLLKDYDGKLNLILKQFDERIGVGKARNEGLNLATGKYVYFIDSDDYLYSNALEKLIEVAHQTDRISSMLKGPTLLLSRIGLKRQESLQDKASFSKMMQLIWNIP